MDNKHEAAIIERMVPAMCQLTAINGLASENVHVDMQTVMAPLALSVRASMKGCTPIEMEVLLVKAQRVAKLLLNGEPGSYRQMLLASCMFVMKLVDEGAGLDPRSQPVLIGLSMIEDAKHDEDNSWGYDRKKLSEAGSRMLTRARLLGFFMNKSLYIQ